MKKKLRNSKKKETEKSLSDIQEYNSNHLENLNNSIFLHISDKKGSTKTKTRKSFRNFHFEDKSPVHRQLTLSNLAKNSNSKFKLPHLKTTFLASQSILPNSSTSRRKSEEYSSFKIYKECLSEIRPKSNFIKEKLKQIHSKAKKKKKLIDIQKKISKDLESGKFSNRSLRNSLNIKNFKTEGSLDDEILTMEKNKNYFEEEVNRRGLKDFNELHEQIRSIEKLKKLKKEHMILEQNFKKEKGREMIK